MPGLILKLGPGERFVANGVVIENGDRRARLNILTPDSKVLRLRDAIHPDDVDTPVKRVCYIVQLALAGEAEPEEAKRQASLGVRQLMGVFTDADSTKKLEKALEDLEADKLYPVIRSLQSILPVEAGLMALAGQQERQ